MIVRSALIALVIIAASHPVHADQYPVKPIRLIVPFPPGGPLDILGRLLADGLTPSLAQRVIVDNRPGAAGRIGVEAASKSAPDGYTLLISGPGPIAAAPGLFAKLPYDPVESFAPITLLTATPYVAVANTGLAVRSLGELIERARSAPGSLSFASHGNGHPMHIAGEMFKASARVDLIHVPYKDSNQALADLVAGRTHVMFSSVMNFRESIRAGKLNALAIAAKQRSPLLPEVPTAAESGLPGFEVSTWFGLLAPKRTPADVIRRLHVEAVRVLLQPPMRDTLASQGEVLVGSTPQEFARVIAQDTASWGRAIRAAGIKPE